MKSQLLGFSDDPGSEGGNERCPTGPFVTGEEDSPWGYG